ncbi:hypothetical protein SAG0322_00025 [Streptococcus agalactiae GB00264]|nr:hypothetical protein SAG0104_05390 [Streptococcus agalactiae BSU178]EPU76774.1 hypothetical protein SAG0312_06155 [Streptococcus agalactiae GB00115]EPU94164.1 hypothetical protein SAG0322_00025 [Streptococcus agalactiae GB00264]EPU95386.1 hypothetical protein SAG0323_02625 [Streptococcus agalactiae GB00279]QBX22757.1 hypothetical protein Javan10_0007 [Streptococcus phage Javan10]
MKAITKIAMVLAIAILYIPLAVVAFFSYPIYLLFGKEE